MSRFTVACRRTCAEPNDCRKRYIIEIHLRLPRPSATGKLDFVWAGRRSAVRPGGPGDDMRMMITGETGFIGGHVAALELSPILC